MSADTFDANRDSAKCPRFNGENYPKFRIKMKAILSLKGCGDALLQSFKAKLPASESAVLDETKAGEKLQIEARKKNATAMNYLILALETDELLGKAAEAETVEFPGGIACDLWSALEDDYAPDDTTAEAEMLTKMMALKLTKKENPKTLSAKMASIQAECRCKMAEAQKVSVVVKAAGSLYAETIRQEKKLLKANSETVTAAKLIKEMHEMWRLSGLSEVPEDGTLGAKDEGGKELSVIGTDGKWFPGKCHLCGKTGHKKADCPENKKGGDDVKCEHCGMPHKSNDCWSLEKNAHKRPDWYKKKHVAEVEAVEIVLSSVEVEV